MLGQSPEQDQAVRRCVGPVAQDVRPVVCAKECGSACVGDPIDRWPLSASPSSLAQPPQQGAGAGGAADVTVVTEQDAGRPECHRARR